MLEVTAENLLDEVQAAERLRDLHKDCANDLVKGYVGKSFRRDWKKGPATPANHGFEYVSLMLGRLVADNPAATICARRAGYDELTAALEDALNQWIITEDLQSVITPVVQDSFFFMGVMKVSEEDDEYADATADGQTPRKPKAEQINYWRYFRDSQCCAGIKCRLEGHVCYRDKEDLLKDKEFNAAAIKALVGDSDLEKINDQYAASRYDAPKRDQIVFYEIWVPDAPIPEDYDPALYHGMIYTLGVVPVKDKPRSGFIREPRPFFGPKTGPYVLFGSWPVPGSPYPLAPLAATKEQADENNAHAVAISRAALTMKDLYVVNSSQKKLGNIVKDAETGSVHAVEGFQPNQMQRITIGGPTAEQINYKEMAQNNLDRVSGIDDATRGNLDPKVTATATNRAAQGDSIRTGTMVRFTMQSTKHVLANVAWYMYHSQFFTHTLSPEAAKKTGATVFSGGELDHEQSAGLRYEDLAIDVEPYSMERVDPVMMMQKLTQIIPIALQIAQAQASMPYLNAQPLWDNLARFNNLRWLKTMVDPQIMARFLQSQAQAAQQLSHDQRPPPALPYADAPADVKAQIEQAWGFQPSQLWMLQPLLDPAQPKKSGNPLFLPPGAQSEPSNGLSTHMMGKAGKAGAPGARNAPRNASSTSGMGAPALQGGVAA